MRSTFSARLFRRVLRLLALAVLFQLSTEAHAVPSFARQTGWDCTKCHMSWLELTNVGRRFKLGGYQAMAAMDEGTERPLISFNFNDPPPIIPIAIWVQVARTSTQNVEQQGVPLNPDGVSGPVGTGSAADPLQDPKKHNGTVLVQAASIFLNGKLAEGLGCFCQFTYDAIAQQMAQDNSELRYVPDSIKTDSLKIDYGFSLNNNPTMSDIYNTTPVWGWPYLASATAVGPTANTIINGTLGHSTAGLTVYSLWNNTVYAEVGAYGTPNGPFRALTINNPIVQFDGLAPYYRLSLQHDWQNGVQSAEIGTYGFSPKIYTSGISGGPSDSYTDRGIDAQYQYITDEHRFSFMYNFIHETTNFNYTFANGGSTNPGDTLNQLNTKFSYYYKKWYGISAGYQRVSGTPDPLLYNGGNTSAAPVTGSLNGNPESAAKIFELDWLFAWDNAEDRRRNRIILQYTAYDKFNGASTNYDGYGRNARDNNTIYLAWWSVY